MAFPPGTVSAISNAWEVLVLFLIPVGGGIPAGVLLARSRNIVWPEMMFLYFISDVILACLFEPLMLAAISLGKHSHFLSKVAESLKAWTKKTATQYGASVGPFALIMIAFGADPMTGRTAALGAGHGFVTGWALAIAGDMLYFTVLMVSTLWLSQVLGDGTMVTLIILVGMMVVPILVRKIRDKLREGQPRPSPRN